MKMMILNLMNNSFRRKSDATLNLFRYTAMVFVLLLGVGNVWGTPTYKQQLAKVTQNNTGLGRVYAAQTDAEPSADSYYTEKSTPFNASTSAGTYFLYAIPAQRGVEFDNWTESTSVTSGATKGSVSITNANSTSASISVGVASGGSGSNTYTTSTTVTANWKTQNTKVVVTYGAPTDGSYRVTYSYSYLNTSTNEIETGHTFDMVDGASSRNEDSYNLDVITLQSLDGTFLGWYSDAGFKTPLSDITDNGDGTYTYVVPASGTSTASVYAEYKHEDKYYGRITVSIPDVPYSMPGGGTIAITTDPAASATYSDATQEASITSFGTSQTYYLYAKPNDRRYVFRGWYSDAQCTSLISSSTECTYNFTAESTNSASPTLGNIYAAFDFNLYYMQVEVEPAIPSQGMVLASDTKLTTLPDYTGYSSESSVFTYAYRGAPTKDVYVYAKPKYGYKLAGWYTDAACTSAASVASDGKYMATGSSISPLDPTIIKLYAKFVEEDKINVTYNNPDHTKGEYKAYALDIAEINDEYVWSQVEIFSSIGKSANTVQSQYKTDVLILEAEPLSGYGVTKWYDEGDKTSVSHLYNTTATAAKTVGVTFGDAKPFKVGDNYYVTLSEALTAVGSSGTIIVVQNAYVPAGNYSIPSGVTLLVPYEAAAAVHTKPAATTSGASSPTLYVNLTLAKDANLNVSGKICVDAKLTFAMGYNARPLAGYGQITMNEGSNINMLSGSNLYVWGYITGKGAVSAASGAKVNETFQFGYRGYWGTSRFIGASQKAFPFNQYYIQSIEVPLTLQYGATESVYTGLHKDEDPVEIVFIGSTTGLFRLSSGTTVRKYYDGQLDRQVYELNGNASLSNIQIGLMGMSMDSKDYTLPITNNMDLYILSGETKINSDVEILPDAKIVIGEGASVSIASGVNVYVYDSDQWNRQYAYVEGDPAVKNNASAVVRPVLSAPGQTGSKRLTVTDAKFDVNGELKVSGALYTTAGGANIYSTTGTGKVIIYNVGDKTITYQPIQYDGDKIKYDNISINPSRLHNADDSYTATADAISGDQFIYSNTQGKWLKNPKTISWNANGGTTEANTMSYSEGSFVGELPAATKDGYDLVGWFTTVDGGTQISPADKVTADATYHAHWTLKTYTITYKNQGESTFAGSTHIDTPNEHPTTHTFNTVTTLNGATRAGYAFGGWYKTVSCTGTKVTSLGTTDVTKDITLYAKWIPEHTLTIEATPAGYGTVTATSVANIPEGSTITVSGNTLTVNGTTVTATPKAADKQYTYTFKKWNNVPDAVTGDVTVEAEFERTTYTITWIDGNGETLLSEQLAYGETPNYTGETPGKKMTTGVVYTFKGWTPEPTTVTDNATYTATFLEAPRPYPVLWVDWDGHTLAWRQRSYGDPAPPASQNTSIPTRASENGKVYTFSGWSDPVSVVEGGDVTYTALYRVDLLANEPSLPVEINEDTEVVTTTVRVSGALHIANNAKLTTTDLILEAGESQSGEITGNVVANNVYFDLAIEADKRHWNVFGVPFEIGDLDNTKLQYKNSGETTWHNMILGTHYDITYHDEATRASRGPVYDCWKYIEDLPAGNRTLQPGVAYSISLLFHVDTLRFTKASNSPIHYSENVDLVNTNTGDATNGGWNGIANPTTYHTLLATGVDMIQIHDGGEIGHDTYDAYRIEDYKFVVGKAGYVQVHTSASVLSVDEAGGQAPIPSVHAAPRRSNGITASELYTVELSAENMRTDRVYVKADEDKADEYTIGSDVMKLSTSQARPQIWVEQYNVKLCKSTMAPVNGQTVYPLGLYAPVAGEYTITNNQSAEVEEENTLYLTYDGLPIWNLTDAPYSIQLEKGTSMHYGLLLVRNYAPSVTTGTEEIQTGLQAAQKVIWNDQVYILRGGEVYTVTGKKVQ